MSSAYDIDAINRTLGLGNDTDAMTAVLPDLDEHEKTQRHAEPWLPAACMPTIHCWSHATMAQSIQQHDRRFVRRCN